MTEILVSSTTVSTAYTRGTSYEAVDVWTRIPGQTGFSFSTEYWNTFTTSSTSSTSSTSTTESTSVSSTRASSSSTNSESTESHSSSGLSGGAVAGIAIACAVAGLILGVIAAFFLFRRRRRRGPDAKSRAAVYDSQEKPLRSHFSADRLQLDQFLLDPTPDAEIRTEMNSLAQLLQQHVENHYHKLPVTRSVDALSTELGHLELDQSGVIPADELASLALDPRTRYAAIQHIISRVTFASVSLDGASPFSLLPQPVSAFVKLLPPTENYRGNSEAVNTALTRWRQLSAFLLHPNRSDRTPLAPSEDVSTRQAQRLAVALNGFLEPFVAGGRDDRYEQENHLREVMVECATLGYLIFSQPSEFRFRFEGGVTTNQIVVFPGVDRVSDEEGHRYHPLTQPVVAPVFESI